MDYKSTLPNVTLMLTQEQKHARLQWASQHKDNHCSRTISTDKSCFATPFVYDHEIQVLKSNRWYEEVSASRTSLVIIPLQQFWMVPAMFKFFKIISFLMQEDNLVDDGDCNRIMILNIKIDWLSNSCLVK